MKAGQAGKGEIHLSSEEIACDGQTATYRFKCLDTGRGMSDSFLSHAFEPFAQEDSSARTSYMGTGLGLSIVKQLVEMMGENIDVESEINVEIARFILENAGMMVTAARNGKEAVDLFAVSGKNQFDLILMDVMMPIMDGLTATKTIRQMNRADAQKIPIFAMTANAFTEDVELSREAGMNEHLSKPLDVDKMTHMMKQYIMMRKKSEKN